MKEITENEARLRLSALCSQAEHCSHEMVEKMRRWAVPDDAQARIMEYLTTNRFVDDERFARVFAADKIKYNKWGRRKVEQAMWQKGIDRDVQQRVLDDIDDEEYMAVLRPLMKSKRKSIKAANEYEMNMKLTRFGVSRGFGYDQIRRCLDGDMPDAADCRADCDSDDMYED